MVASYHLVLESKRIKDKKSIALKTSFLEVDRFAGFVFCTIARKRGKKLRTWSPQVFSTSIRCFRNHSWRTAELFAISPCEWILAPFRLPLHTAADVLRAADGRSRPPLVLYPRAIAKLSVKLWSRSEPSAKKHFIKVVFSIRRARKRKWDHLVVCLMNTHTHTTCSSTLIIFRFIMIRWVCSPRLRFKWSSRKLAYATHTADDHRVNTSREFC